MSYSGETGPLVVVNQGSHYTTSFGILEDGADKVLTGFTALLQVRSRPALSGAVALLTLDEDYLAGAGGITLTAGQISFEITGSQTDAMAALVAGALPGGVAATPRTADLIYELKIIDPNNVPESIAIGTMRLIFEIADTAGV